MNHLLAEISRLQSEAEHSCRELQRLMYKTGEYSILLHHSGHCALTFLAATAETDDSCNNGRGLFPCNGTGANRGSPSKTRSTISAQRLRPLSGHLAQDAHDLS